LVLDYELRDPKSSVMTDGAPARYNVRRLIEYSDFAGWEDISGRWWTLFDAAATLAPESPVRAEVARIAAVSSDPVVRAQAALALVQGQIRYVYVGLNGGNYRPASADETWKRRFGDCKGKTALLLAVLRALGIEAQAVLVNSNGGDGMDERLPSPLMFDHVLVRATIAGKTHWLDGTRLGDQWLTLLPPVPYRWALPLRSGGAALEAVPARAPRAPQFVGLLDVDARGGIDKPGKVTAQHILRGDETYGMRTSLAGMSGEDADRALKAYWRQQADWVDADTVSWRYDDKRAALVLGMTGTGKLDWDGSDQDGWSYYLAGGGFYPPDIRKRPKEQAQDAPWAIAFPRFRCWGTIVRLPKPSGAWHWNIVGKKVNRSLGGIAYWRGLSLADNVVRSVQSSRSIVPEISAAEARATNDAIPGFDKKMTRIDQDFGLTADVGRVEPMLAQGDAIDWLAEDTPCDGPAPVQAGG
ncbi:MAG: transglutaminase domain-containing protein, partial [bacterium]|nr:transglutaminase domain-containing protein [bacterium]